MLTITGELQTIDLCNRVLASDIGHKWDLHSKPRQEIEDDVLAIELKIRKDQLGVIDGGKE